MKIVLVIEDMHPRTGGPPVVVAGSAVALAKKGHKVTILTVVRFADEDEVMERWKDLSVQGVDLRFVRKMGFSSLFRGIDHRSLIAKVIKDCDVVHIHGVWTPLAIFATRTSRKFRKPYFVSVHGVFDKRAMTRVRRKWLKKRLAIEILGLRGLLEDANGVIFGSASEASESWMPSSKLSLMFIPNGLDFNVGISPVTSDQAKLLASEVPSLGKWKRTILCRSRIHEEKGIDLLIQAFHRIADEFPDCGLLIAGLQQDARYQIYLENLIVNGPAEERIFLTTRLTGPDTSFVYKIADIFVMPSLAEGFSMGLVEGLAYARPMLVTRYCHMPSVQNVGAGLVVEPLTGSLANALRLMLNPSSDLAAMGGASRKLFEEQYTWDRIATTLELAYSAAGDSR